MRHLGDMELSQRAAFWSGEGDQWYLRNKDAIPNPVVPQVLGRLRLPETPTIVEVIEDLITPEAGLAIAERDVDQGEVGGSPRHLPDIVLGVVRAGKLYRVDHSAADALEPGDRLLYVKKVTPAEE